MTGFEQEFLTTLIYGLVLIFPVWRIYERAGLNPAYVLFLFVPYVGWFVVLAILGLMDWPSARRRAEQ